MNVVARAAEEALRNSVRHAGVGARRWAFVWVAVGEVRVEVGDDGIGFDPVMIDPQRLGVRGSILARMRALPGGAGTVVSAPGDGTVVVLTWTG
mgnify:FL=1